VYDLAVTETIMRLTDVAETALDIGANIGYMSLVLAMSTGPRGSVLSFEPNPDVLPRLRTNVNHWRSLQIAPIEVNAIALSDRDGQGHLGFPSGYDQNTGLASLEANGSVPVSVCRLDSLGIGRIGVMKVDVEGHETAVFAGAQNLLAKGLIRDILFEEHQPYPAGSHEVLLGHGYEIFRVTRSTWRPLLLPPESMPRQAYLPSNFLGTRDPARARSRLQPRGWYALRSGNTAAPIRPKH
jgi:FkbM family methyltransferase